MCIRVLIGAGLAFWASMASAQEFKLTAAESITVERWNAANADNCAGIPGTDLAPNWPDFKDRSLTLWGYMGEPSSGLTGCLFRDVDGVTAYVFWTSPDDAVGIKMRLEEALTPDGLQSFVPAVDEDRARLACEVADKEHEANQVGSGSLLPRGIRRSNAAGFRKKHGFAPGEAAAVCKRFLDQVAGR